MKNIIILSGGMDSTTLLYKERKNIKLAISFDYGQKHVKEVIYARHHCEKLKIPHSIIDLKNLFKYIKSDLLKSGKEIPNGNYDKNLMKQTVVPFRNGIFISVACGIAESVECDNILIANHAGDHEIYPDCRPRFIASMSGATVFGTYRGINIHALFLDLYKSDILELGARIKIDYTKTWSCYKGGSLHCGKCSTCLERKSAFSACGIKDETEYEL